MNGSVFIRTVLVLNLSARTKQLVQMKLNKSKLFLFMPHVSFEFFLTWFLLTFVDALDSDCLAFPEVFPGIYQPSASARSCAFACVSDMGVTLRVLGCVEEMQYVLAH